MKILLQRTDSLLFFKNLDEWTDKPEEALTFTTTSAASDTCRNYGFSNARIALVFEDRQAIYFSCSEETVVSPRNVVSHLDGGEAATGI
ncbi:MAG: hypothetical protein FJ403_18380 [Verrucomicrobia bacterium]|nr:hypothetical protein [Verrucomicrobiota bacterium]